jgi:hypothetical protein
MLVLERDPSCFLVELSDLAQEPPPELIRDCVEPLRQIASWAESYLSNPHPDLGRTGPVCPYTPHSLKTGKFYLTVCRGRDFTQELIAEHLLKYRDWFLEIEPREGSESFFKTILVLFPDMPMTDVPLLIEGTQVQLRPDYVLRGLMVGEFHAGPPQKAGLWNPDFRPLFSPIPMLVIRNMVPTDFVFLRDDPALMARYQELFGNQVPPHLTAAVTETLRRHGLPITLPEPG